MYIRLQVNHSCWYGFSSVHSYKCDAVYLMYVFVSGCGVSVIDVCVCV